MAPLTVMLAPGGRLARPQTRAGPGGDAPDGPSITSVGCCPAEIRMDVLLLPALSTTRTYTASKREVLMSASNAPAAFARTITLSPLSNAVTTTSELLATAPAAPTTLDTES